MSRKKCVDQYKLIDLIRSAAIAVRLFMKGTLLPDNFPQAERLRQQIAACQAQGDLLTQKLAFMERDLLLETRADEKFRLEHLIAPLMVGERGRSGNPCQVFQNLAGVNFIYFNLEWVESEDDFYDALCDELHIESCRGYEFTRALKGKRYVLCLDEIEKMAWDSFTVNLRSHLRGLADGPAAPLKLVIASRSPLAHLFPDSPERDSPLAGICRQIDVLPFSAAVAREFLIQR